MKQQPNPLVPQGTFESQARGKSHVRIAVFTILAIHVVVLGALLIQGCKRDSADTTATTDTSTPTNEFSSIPPFAGSNDLVTSSAPSNPAAAVPPFATTSTPPVGTGAAPYTSAPALPPVTQTSAVPPAPFAPAAEAAPLAPATEHVIVKGDTLSTLSTKYGVSVRAIQKENPNLNPTRLKIGDKVKIPAKSTASAGNAGTSFSSPTAAASSDVYTVKSGDTLSKIAKSHGTTAREIQKLNNLTTTQIKVGQKLKMPSRASAPATATPTPAAPGGLAPTPPGGVAPAPFPAPAQ